MVSKFIIMRLSYFILLFSVIFSFERGLIHSIEFLDYKNVEEIQAEIDNLTEKVGNIKEGYESLEGVISRMKR